MRSRLHVVGDVPREHALEPGCVDDDDVIEALVDDGYQIVKKARNALTHGLVSCRFTTLRIRLGITVGNPTLSATLTQIE
jgi:hypothetical protein